MVSSNKSKSKPKRSKSRQERGQILVWIVFMLPAMLAMVGLVFDGGMMWNQFRRAQWSADGAAVAAASEIDAGVYRDTGRVMLGDDAYPIAVHYARQNDAALHVTAVYIQDNVVHVKGWVQIDTYFLGIFGVSGTRVSVHGRERPAWGISEREQ